MPTVLDKIVAHKRTEIAAAKRRTPLPQLVQACRHAVPVRPFAAALRASDGVSLIAEIKKASPSRGVIRSDFQPVAIAAAYQQAGAACISVLTDREFFQGGLEILEQVRKAVEVPVLRKDFVVDPYQVYEARAAGADAVLLIAECLPDNELKELFELIGELGMSALVELYLEENLARVLALQPPLVGVNSRDLRTFEVDLERCLRMRQQVPENVTFVAESGIRTPDDVKQLADGRVDAMLVGETLMASSDIRAATQQLVDAGNSSSDSA